jgi:hypothetical protein
VERKSSFKCKFEIIRATQQVHMAHFYYKSDINPPQSIVVILGRLINTSDKNCTQKYTAAAKIAAEKCVLLLI